MQLLKDFITCVNSNTSLKLPTVYGKEFLPNESNMQKDSRLKEQGNSSQVCMTCEMNSTPALGKVCKG